jgi:drug/metabolite transporter (DMT)-like permease
MFLFWPIAFGTGLSILDCIVMTWLKKISIGEIAMNWKTLAFPVAIYATTPLIFLYSMMGESMTVMNLMWDVISSVLVSAIGLYYFKEKLSHTRILGVLVSFVAIYLLSYDEN